MPGLTQGEGVLLSLCYSDKKLGAAVYFQSNATIKILHDVTEGDDFSVVNSLVHQVEPSLILACKSQDLEFIRFLSLNSSKENEPLSGEPDEEGQESSENAVADSEDPDEDDEEVEDEEEERNPFKDAKLHILPAHCFKYDQSKARLTELLAAEALCPSEKDLLLMFRVDISYCNMTRSFGALLQYMDATRFGVEFETYDKRTPISNIKTFAVNQMVEMDFATYKALDIYGDNKKNMGGWKKAVKDNEATLFSLMNKCRSTPGKHTLMKWFDHPTLDREILKWRQKAISYFIQDSNSELTSEIHSYLGRVRNVKMILKRMQGGTCKVPHWKIFYDTVINLVAIGRALGKKRVSLALLDEFTEFFGDKLAEIATVISHIIDFDESEIEDRLVANIGVDPDLDEAKRLYRKLPTILTKVAEDEAQRLGAETCSVGYVPILGYLIALPIDFMVDDFPDLKLVYGTEDKLHMKSHRMNRLDEELGDIKMQIIDKETIIAMRLQKIITDDRRVLIGAVKGAAVLDAIISMAMSARLHGWNCPAFSDEPVIDAVNSVHPLTKAIGRSHTLFVPNPISSGGDDTKMKILTGPNACGKSIYMKQTAILAFMAHIGSFVPADRCIIGPINRIITRVYTVDGVLDGMSTFAKDLSQVAVALRRANQFSLVIIDEFGKGTLTEVGLSLLTATLNYWLEKGKAACPHVLVSSHFHSLPQFVFGKGQVSYQTFEVIRRGGQLDFLFRLVPGVIDCSHAAYMALKMGVPDKVIDRANQFYTLLKEGKDHRHLSHMKAFKFEFLCDQMQDFMDEFETWDISNDSAGLLRRAREMLLEETEQLVAEEDIVSDPPEPQIHSADGTPLTEERQERESFEEEIEGGVEKVEEFPSQGMSFLFRDEEPPSPKITGILKSEWGRRERKSLQSVSFAISPPRDPALSVAMVIGSQLAGLDRSNLVDESKSWDLSKRNCENADGVIPQKRPRPEF